MASGSAERTFDETKDVVLVKWKLEIDAKAAWRCRLITHDGFEPKLELERWYVGADGKWRWDKPKKRLPYKVVVSVVEHAAELEKAYEEWNKKPKPQAGSQSGKGGHDEIPF